VKVGEGKSEEKGEKGQEREKRVREDKAEDTDFNI
jgi:hypothetical protein